MTILILIIAYLIGAIPTGLIVGKLFFGVDIRKVGSGNSGATNAYRIFGHKAGLSVLFFDVMKGIAAINLCSEPVMQLLLGLSVISGHVWSIFAEFKGGKGVATTYGVFLAVNPILVILPLCIYVFTFLLFRISSVSSIVSILSLIFSALIINVDVTTSFLILLVCPLILWTHRENIERIINGEEKKLF
jgi:glycerol-3-phosphate acyltransferase PlsY